MPNLDVKSARFTSQLGHNHFLEIAATNCVSLIERTQRKHDHAVMLQFSFGTSWYLHIGGCLLFSLKEVIMSISAPQIRPCPAAMP